MSQLKMDWVNDNVKFDAPELKNGITVKSIDQLDDGVNMWVDILKVGFTSKEVGPQYYTDSMSLPNFEENKCFIFFKDGAPCATITVVCDYEKKHGLIHMVGCKPDFRGLGIGTLLSEYALYVLKREGMKTSSLRTDDWRVPAIKTYLKVGFKPDLTTEPDYKERWEKIFESLKM